MIALNLKGCALVVIAFILSGCSKPSNSQTINPKTSSPAARTETREKLSDRTVYGTDNRHDIYNEPDADIRALADSTVALLKETDLGSSVGGTYTLHAINYGKAMNLCPSEPFRDQDTAPYCSGFLVAPDTIVSAGHCITNDVDCRAVVFVFGFAYTSPSVDPKIVPESEVYRCSRIVHTQAPGKGADFSIVKLDRPVWRHQPLKLRTRGAISKGDGVFVIGHPSGLPVKIAGDAKVRDDKPADGFFVANTDTFGGNSGSAIFNSQTLEVEGVLVRGEVDYVRTPEGCLVANVCDPDHCRGEDITKILEVEKYISSADLARVKKKVSRRAIVDAKRAPQPSQVNTNPRAAITFASPLRLAPDVAASLAPNHGAGLGSGLGSGARKQAPVLADIYERLRLAPNSGESSPSPLREASAAERSAH